MRISELKLSKSLEQELYRELAEIKKNNLENNDDSESLLEQLSGPSKVTGAFFICQPYCQFKAFLYGPAYVVDPEDLKSDNVRYLDKSEDQFRALFGSDEELNKNSKDEDKKNEDLRNQYRKKVIKSEEDKRDKSWIWWSYGLSLYGSKQDVSTDTNLQTNLASNFYEGYGFFVRMMPNFEMQIKKQKLYLQLSYEIFQSYNRVSAKAPEQKVNSGQSEMRFGLRGKRNDWNAGLGYLQFQNEDRFSDDSIPGFSSKQTVVGLYGMLGYRGFSLDLSQSLAVQVSESQGYRTSPFDGSWRRLRLSYCGKRRTLPVLGAVVPCGGLEQANMTQSSGVASNIIIGRSSVNIDSSTQLLFVKLAWGQEVLEKMR